MRTGIFISALLCAHLSTATARPAGTTPAVHVDPRVELMSIVFHLAGDPAYQKLPDTRYVRDVDSHFKPFAKDPVVTSARRLRAEHDISQDAPIALAVYLDPDTLALTSSISAMPADFDPRWRGVDTASFLAELRAFVKKSGYTAFFAQHHGYFSAMEKRFSDFVADQTIVGWLDAATTLRDEAEFTIVPGLLTGTNNYGPRVVTPDGSELRFQIVGTERLDVDDLPDPTYMTTMLLVHETAHSYVNPFVHGFPKLIASGDVVIEKRRAQVTSNYRTGETLIDESLCRVFADRYVRDKYSRAAADSLIAKEDAPQGFTWMPSLIALFDEYEADRKRYPDLRAFEPRLETFFAELAK